MSQRYAILICMISMSSLLMSCTSKSKSSDVSAKGAEGVPTNPVVLSDIQILDRYNLIELNSAANALRVLLDQSLSSPEEVSDPALASCKISGDDAKKLLMPLKSLMDTQMGVEREAYMNDSVQYARTHALEACAAQCACGTMLSVLDPLDINTLRKPAEKAQHRRYLKHLEAKAARQTNEESATCARKTAWFCTSDLRAYLEREAQKNGQ